jgi:hypothetical protein
MLLRRTLILSSILLAAYLLAACNGLSSQQKIMANNMLKVLLEVDAYTQTGISYAEYSSLVTEAQVSVKQASTVLPDGELKKELGLAIEAYNDAYEVWEATTKQDFIFPPYEVLAVRSLDEAQYFENKYSIPFTFKSKEEPGMGLFSLISKEDALKRIWKSARAHIDQASKLLEQ